MVIQDRDISRFADRSRELWSEQNMSETRYKENTFLRCCGSCPFASLLAFVLTLTGTGLFCGCFFFSTKPTIEKINLAFQTEYIDVEWIHLLRHATIFILGIMGGLSLILLIVGSLSTGATRYQVYTGFRSRLGGRIAMCFFSIIVYGLLIFWLLVMIALTLPSISLYILKHRCEEALKNSMPSGWTDTVSPTVCLTPKTYGLPVPSHKPDVSVCHKRFYELCSVTEHIPKYWVALLGAFFVVMGLVHFLCCLVANYVHIKDGRKLQGYEEAIREEMEISKLNQ